jgi:hypothetical protein
MGDICNFWPDAVFPGVTCVKVDVHEWNMT